MFVFFFFVIDTVEGKKYLVILDFFLEQEELLNINGIFLFYEINEIF